MTLRGPHPTSPGPSLARRALTCLVLLGLAVVPAAAFDHGVEAGPAMLPAVIQQVAEEGTERSRVMEYADVFANQIGPRLTGSRNLREACRRAVELFEAMGLEPRLEPWGEVEVGFERGPSRGALVSPEVRELEFITRAWSAGTDGPVRGTALVQPRDAEALAALEDRLPGAWILVPRAADASDEAFREARQAAYDAAGIAGRVRPSSAGELLRMGGSPRITWDDLPTDVTVTLKASDFEALVALLDDGQAVELEFDIDNRFVEGPHTQFNVVADLPGQLRPNETVIVGAHLDSWDGASGAIDNGSGVATTLEAARILTTLGLQPVRTIRFMLFTGEEQGLLGSRAWVSDHPDELPDICAVLVHDGGTNAIRGIQVTRAMEPQAAWALEAAVQFGEMQGRPFELERVVGLSPGSSDHDSFLVENVPAFFWRQEGEADYTETHHTQHDHYDRLLPEDQKHSATTVALAALGLGQLAEPLDRRGLRRVRRSLGVFLEDDKATVRGVAPRSQAETLGVGAGDRFLTVNAEEVRDGNLLTLRDAGEGRKLITWQHAQEVRSGVFQWDQGDLEHDPERVELTTADGLTVVGDYYMGRVKGPAQGGALVLLPMNQQDRHSWLEVRDELYEAGIATLALDPRGFGESAIPGRTAAMLLTDRSHYQAMVADTRAAVAWLEARGYAPERIGLMGASVGSSVALLTATADPRLAGVAALTPGSDYNGLDTEGAVEQWDGRPLLLVSAAEEARRGADQLHRLALDADPWTPVQLVTLFERSIHGTRMFGAVSGIEARIAEWWTRVLR